MKNHKLSMLLFMGFSLLGIGYHSRANDTIAEINPEITVSSETQEESISEKHLSEEENSSEEDNSEIPQERSVSWGGRGKFLVKYEDTQLTGDIVEIVKNIKDAKYVDEILEFIEQEIWLPYDVPVVFKDCGDANAFWQPEEKEIQFCYELINIYSKDYNLIEDQDMETIFSGTNKDEIIAGTTIFILAHELAHGLTDIFNIPITGREEDAVDQFAALLLSSGDEKNTPREERMARFALYGAYFFKYIAEASGEITRSTFSDEHGLGQMRYYDVMCLIYGSDTDFYEPIFTRGFGYAEEELGSGNFSAENQDLITEALAKHDEHNLLPYARALRCDAEYNKYFKSWDYLLNTFTNNPSWAQRLQYRWFQIGQKFGF